MSRFNSCKQTTMNNFFTPCKGPLTFQTSSFKSCPKQKKKKRRSKQVKKENSDNEADVIIVKDEEEGMEEKKPLDSKAGIRLRCNVPLSPQITFNGSTIFGDGSDNEVIDGLPSPPKQRRTSFDRERKVAIKMENFENTVSSSKNISGVNYVQTSSQVVNIAVTKSLFEIKVDDNKLSRTQKMNSCQNAMISYIVSDVNDCDTKNLYVPPLKTIIDIGMEDVEFDLKENDDSPDSINVIKNHLAKVRTIIKNYTRPNFENLLFENEKNLLISFFSLNTSCQFVCCKLFTHKIKWYKCVSFIENLRNCALSADIVQVDVMVRLLEENGFVFTDYKSEELPYLLSLLKLDDIKKIHKDLRLKGKIREKQQYINAILSHISRQTTLDPLKPMDSVVKSMVYSKLGAMFKITESFYNVFYKIHLMYSFANHELDIPQGLYKFMSDVLYNNNILPRYKISDESIFETAEEFAAFCKAYSYKDELLQEWAKKNSDKQTILKLCEEIFEEFKIIIKADNIEQRTKPGFLNRFTAGWKYASALVFGVDKLSATYPASAKLWLEELLKQNYFHIRKRSLLYSQLAIIYKKYYKDNQTACEILAKGLRDDKLLLSDVCELIYRSKSYMKKGNSSECFRDVIHLFRKVPDVKKFPAVSINGYCDSMEPLYKYINDDTGDTEYLRVEELALRYYIQVQGYRKGIHCEGAIMNTLFHILFWDIIYADGIAQVFINPIQRIPLDLYHNDFYKRRQESIDRRIINIKSGWSAEELVDYVERTWTEASNCTAVILKLDLEHVLHIVNVLGRKIVANICEKFAKQYNECHAGLPDLFLWNDKVCKFVEVKGPGDHLSTKQKLWIHFLLEIGADVEVCYVRRMGGRR